MKEMKKKVGCESASLWLLEDDKIVPYIFAGPKGQELEGIELALGEGICGQCIQTGEAIISNDPANEVKWARKTDEQTGYQTRNLICMPITINDECVGCIELLNKEEDFTAEDIRACEELIEVLVEEL